MSSEDLAYVTYTSGSTGTPKGVEVPHRGVLRLVLDVCYVTLNSEQTVLHFASLSFDVSTFEIWAPLLHGARCVLYHPDLPILSELQTIITRNRVSIVALPTTIFNAIIDEIPHALNGVGQILVGGDALSVRHVRKALTMLPEAEIYNSYGPTESTMITCSYRVPRTLDENCRSIPIGIPIERTWVYILDQALCPVAKGEPGELCTGGDGIARGYLNRPDLTAEKFIANPFDPEVAPKIYRTGDLVRMLEDGNIEFLGRIDDQVKISGYRIELGEIESCIRSHESIRDAAVLLKVNELGDKTIVAYVQPTQQSTFALGDLQAHIREYLPAYMMPSVILVLPMLPLTSGNKIDRRALPDPWQKQQSAAPKGSGALTEIELVISIAWREVLQSDSFGLDDNFFEVGGRSISAVRVHRHLQDGLKKDIPITMLFQYPTIRSLAAGLSENGENAALTAANERAGRQAAAMQQRRQSPIVRKLR
jgi:amino acid adenylation domain-containing protein